MKKQLVFIDDSGDPGMTEVSSTNFVMAAALFMDPGVADALSVHIAEYRRSLGWRDDYEFKFAKIRKDIIVHLLKNINEYEFRIYAVYLDKARFKNAAQLVDDQKIYNWMIKELLIIMPIYEAKIKIDGRSSRENMRKTAAYLRQQINRDRSKKLEINFEDSVDNNLIQLADLIAGSINRFVSADKTDYEKYIKIFRKKIVRIKRIE